MAAPKRNKNHLKHGQRNTRLYHIWQAMKQRCFNPNAISFKNYGGKGILICDEWANSFQTFYEWAMANGYAKNLTIDRINSDGNYEPSNCRWASYKSQANNRKSNRFVEYQGEIHTIAEWAKKTGIRAGTIHSRLEHGWSIERTLNTVPVIGRNQFN